MSLSPDPSSTSSSLRLLVIADVGGDEMRHIGDEAMLESNLQILRRRMPGVSFTVVSRDPGWAASRYGVEAVAPLGFSRDPAAGAERGARLDRVLAEASGPARGSENATVAAVARADGVVVSGGGNLSSTWPDLLYERAALVRVARVFEKPAVVLGQTIGPRLEGDERRTLADALSWARFVGIRELPSAALALDLGVPADRLWYQSDDALFFEGAPAPVPTGEAHGAPAIAVTIDPQVRAAGEEVFGALVDQLRELSEATDARLVLIPHEFGREPANGPSDFTEALVLAERIGLSTTAVAAGFDAAQARAVTGGAELVISTRYHPIVFGLAAGVPCIGIHADDYCRIKLQGALAHANLERWSLAYDDVRRGKLLPAAMEIWRARRKVRRNLESIRDAWRQESRERWDAVLRALHALDPAETVSPADPARMFGRPLQEVAPALRSALAARRQAGNSDPAPFDRLAACCDDAQRGLHDLGDDSAFRRTVRRYATSLRSKFRGDGHPGA